MSENFQILDERTHIEIRAGMYIGSTSLEEVDGIFFGKNQKLKVVSGLLKIINEIIDNSVDEYIRTDGKFANRIEVNFNTILGSRSEVEIIDNGRGIPIKKIGDHYIPELAWTRARAGSNFNDDSLRETMGMNGVGSFATNVFSSEFEGSTCDGTATLVVSCFDNAKNIEVKKYSITDKKYTKVRFTPDFDKFEGIDEITDDHVKYIEDRLMNLSVTHPGIAFILNGKKIQLKIKDFASQFGDNYFLIDEPNLTAVITISKDEEFHLLSYVNGLNVKNGGSHVETFMSSFINELRPIINKKHKIDILPNQIKQHLTLAFIVRKMKNLKFDSQTKERVTNTTREIQDHFGDINYNKIAKNFFNNDELIKPIIEAILYKKELADRLALARNQKKNKNKRIVNHIEAQSKNIEEKILCVAEGQSAIGPLIAVRDPNKIGGYPLKGKVMNTYGMKATEIIKNKELSELMSIIGLEFGKKAVNLNYGKIAILTDADVDGGHIACLLTVFFLNWKELFDEKRIVRIETPLIIASKGKEKKYFYNLKEYNDCQLDKGWSTKYYKGLGSLPQEIYKDIINKPKMTPYILTDEDKKHIEMAFGNDSDKRKDWMMK